MSCSELRIAVTRRGDWTCTSPAKYDLLRASLASHKRCRGQELSRTSVALDESYPGPVLRWTSPGRDEPWTRLALDETCPG